MNDSNDSALWSINNLSMVVSDVGTSLLNALTNDEKDILENILKKISNETV